MGSHALPSQLAVILPTSIISGQQRGVRIPLCTISHVLFISPKCRPLLKTAYGCARHFKAGQVRAPLENHRDHKNPISSSRGRIKSKYVCKDKHQHRWYRYLYASCNFNNKKLGQLRPRANMCPAGWGSTPSQSRTTELVEVSLHWPTP